MIIVKGMEIFTSGVHKNVYGEEILFTGSYNILWGIIKMF
jgi:hypothetical protein